MAAKEGGSGLYQRAVGGALCVLRILVDVIVYFGNDSVVIP